jgi:type IV pilus assembly protein PilN
MIRINLLPFRTARKKENIRRQASGFLLLLILVLFTTVAFHFVLNKKVTTLNAKVEYTRNELSKYNKINQEIAQIKKQLDVLDKKLDVVKTIEMNRRGPIELLDTMTQMVIENRMWLTGFTVKGNDINLQGVAVDNETVADFMRRLESSKLFPVVDLKTLKQQFIGTEKMSFKGFEINCNRLLNLLPEATKTTANKKANT